MNILEKENKVYYLALDGIRGYLILIVMAFHMETNIDPNTYNIQWLFDGRIAVDIFLVISGFLITKMLYIEENQKKSVSLKAFYIRRIFRLLPVFLLTIFVYLLVGLFVPGQEEIFTRTMDSLPYHLTMRSEYIPEHIDKSLGHAWSLSVEEKFYLVWPVLIFTAIKVGNLRLLMHILPFFLMPLFLQESLYYSYLALIIGSYLGFLDNQNTVNGKIGIFYKYTSTRWFGYLAFIAFAISYTFYKHSYDYTEKLFVLIPIALLVAHLIYGNSIIVKFFSHPFHVFTGKKAYAMYLLHMVIVTGVQVKLLKANSNWNIILTLIISYAILLILATLVYRIVEKPMIVIGKRISDNIQNQKALCILRFKIK